MAKVIEKTLFTKEEVIAASLEYFDGDKLAASVFADKYALRDRDGNFHESDPSDMHLRLAREFARIEAKYPNPLSEEQIFDYLAGFKYIVPQGSPMSGIGNNFQLVSLSNCAVISGPDDTMSSIMERGRDLANLYKRRFGAGLDLSKLRPSGAAVNNSAGSSTGAASFMDLYSFVTRMVGQSGRRGALMLTMDARHPDIEKFVTMKSDPSKVTGANVSVRITDDFMRAVAKDEEYALHWPVGGTLAKFDRVVKARDIFTLIAQQACETAEPGLLFWDNIKRNLPLDYYPGFETESTNPCGELPLPDADSCRLISIYLPSFVKNEFTSEACFDWSKFREVVRAAQRLSDDLVDLELEKLRAIHSAADTQDEKDLFVRFIEKCEKGRRTGLGTHGLADALARLTVRYDSHKGLKWTDSIYRELKIAAYASSIEMAQERGTFPIHDDAKDGACPYIMDLPDDLKERMFVFGRRNGALLTNAPTGSVSILSHNCSSGIEPVFANKYTRRRKIDPAKDDISKAYKDANGDYWIEFAVFHPNVERYLRKLHDANGKIEVPYIDGYIEFADHARLHGLPHGEFPFPQELCFDEFASTVKLPEYFVESKDIEPIMRVKMQGIITKHIDHSVSSTINLPRGTTPEQIEEIYMAAWQHGCKGITVYVDGSRDAQVLTAAPEKTERSETEVIHDPELNVRLLKEDLADLEAKHTTLYEHYEKLQEENQRLLNEWAVAKTAPVGARIHRDIETHGSKYKATFRNIDGLERKVYVYVGQNDAGQIVEVFIHDEKGDEDLRPYASAVGKLVSLLLKHGVPSTEIEESLIGLKGGSVSYSGKIFNSVPDLVGKRLRAVREAEEAKLVEEPSVLGGALFNSSFEVASIGTINENGRVLPPDVAEAALHTGVIKAPAAPDGFHFFGYPKGTAKGTATVTDVTDNGEISPPVFSTGMKGQPTKAMPKGDKCPACGEENVRKVDGCPMCGSCGWSRCS